MSEKQAAQATGVDTVEIRLAPEDIAVNPVFEGLRSNRQSDEYMQQVKRLSLVLKDEGQKQPVLIRTNTTGSEQSYELVFGHRRREAVRLNGDMLVLCRYEDLDDEAAMKAALRENIQAEDFGVMDKARIIMGLRVNAKMTTKAISQYLGVSTATVTETEKLLDLPQDVKERVESGVLSKSAALEYAPVAAEARPAVMSKAEKKAEVEKAAKVAKAEKKGQTAKAQKLKDAPAKVESKHVRAAVRETEGAVEKQKAPARAAIIEMMETFTGPGTAKPVAQMFECWLAWIKGGLTDKQIKAAVGDVEDCIASNKQARDIPAAKHLKPPKQTKAEKTEVRVRRALDIAKGKGKKTAKAKVKAKAPNKAKARAKRVTKVKAKSKHKRPVGKAA